ncbi:MAG TPA: DUF177 domain-containing protein [Anaeromyxobacter sp.]|nr:DUF177 domain-containing protein [Anaeromyxobacter sp.]
MRVNIDEIKDVGLDRSWDVTQARLDEMLAGDRAGYRARGPVHVDARLEKLGRRVRVEGDATAALTAACKRCLAPVSVDVPVELDLTLVPADERDGDADSPSLAERDHEKGQKGGSFSAEDAEEETYTGKVIDLDALVREQLLLSMPEYPVCDEQCKGLCPVCGANLNDRECGCDRHVPDPRWAGLKNVKL